MNIKVEAMPIEFYNGYAHAALWLCGDYDESFLDLGYNRSDIHEDSRAVMLNECKLFWNANWQKMSAVVESEVRIDWGPGYRVYLEYSAERAGHDFWLMRNHHGAAYWDYGELSHKLRAELTELAHLEGTRSLYMGDDGLIHYCEG